MHKMHILCQTLLAVLHIYMFSIFVNIMQGYKMHTVRQYYLHIYISIIFNYKHHIMQPCSLGLSATSQQYFSITTNQPPATSQQYLFSQNKSAPAISHQPTERSVMMITSGVSSVQHIIAERWRSGAATASEMERRKAGRVRNCRVEVTHRGLVSYLWRKSPPACASASASGRVCRSPLHVPP
jgi:hypothetical protein